MEKKEIIRSYQDLKVWQKAISITTEIYKLTETFPPTEKYGLQSQIRSAAISIPSNIAEGHARTSRKEFLHFISMSMGSLAELETQFIIANNLKLIPVEVLNSFQKEFVEIGKMLRGLQKSLLVPSL